MSAAKHIELPPSRAPMAADRCVQLGLKVPPLLMLELDRKAREWHTTRSYAARRLLCESLGISWGESATEVVEGTVTTTAEPTHAA